MFDLRFYKVKDKENVINKTKENEIVKRGTLKDVSSIYNPTVMIKNDSSILTQNYNYVEIPRFNRFYFIEDIVIDDVYSIISLRCDVLESFKEDILNSTQIIGRQETAFNLDLPDNEIVFTNKKFKQIKKFPIDPFDTNSSISATGFYYTLTTGSKQSKVEVT